jgi:hypothetical protein
MVSLVHARWPSAWLIGSTTLALVAAASLLIGIVIDRTILLPPATANAMTSVRGIGAGNGSAGPSDPVAARREAMIRRLTSALDLTPVQARTVDSIIERRLQSLRAVREAMRPQVQAMLDSTRRDLDRLLRPAQRERFRQIRQLGGVASESARK